MAWDVTSLGRDLTLLLPAAFLLQVCLWSWFLDPDKGAFEVCQACNGLHLHCHVGSPLQLCCPSYSKEPRN